MAAFTNAQTQAMPDVIATDRFVFNFGSIPQSANTLTSLSIKCIDAVIPGFSNERFEVKIGAQARGFRGQKNYQRIAQLQFIETVDMSALKALRNWHEFVVGTNSGNSGGYINQYAVTVSMQTYDTTGALADVATFYRVFPVDVQDVPMSAVQTQQMMVSAQLSYDYVVFANTPVL